MDQPVLKRSEQNQTWHSKKNFGSRKILDPGTSHGAFLFSAPEAEANSTYTDSVHE